MFLLLLMELFIREINFDVIYFFLYFIFFYFSLSFQTIYTHACGIFLDDVSFAFKENAMWYICIWIMGWHLSCALVCRWLLAQTKLTRASPWQQLLRLPAGRYPTNLYFAADLATPPASLSFLPSYFFTLTV